MIADEYIISTVIEPRYKQIVLKFPNRYGASLIQGDYSYAGKLGLCEMAVIYFNTDSEYDIDYNTYIASDVLEYMTLENVHETLEKIFNLPEKKT